MKAVGKGAISAMVKAKLAPGGDDPDKSTRLLISPKAGSLEKFVNILSSHGVKLSHVESRSSDRRPGYELMVECERDSGDFKAALDELKKHTEYLNIISKTYQDLKSAIPWFPRRIRDLDKSANQIAYYGPELYPEHPGYGDPEYRSRRQYIADIAFEYRHGQPIPRIDYTEDEIKTWGIIYKAVTALHPTHACKEHNYAFPLFVDNCGYREDNIPQLEDVSNFLKDCTGFTLRPIAGQLNARDFFAGMAFRVFQCTQYVRHSSNPLHSDEPDVCHELIGHAPLFADPAFADFSQQMGLASLGAPDDFIEKLANCFMFTIEYGLCWEGGERKAYGAELLSSFDEIQYCLTDEPELKEFKPQITGEQKCVTDEKQPLYFVVEGFESAMDEMIKFTQTTTRSFNLKYNSHTQSVDILDSPRQMKDLMKGVRREMELLMGTVDKL